MGIKSMVGLVVAAVTSVAIGAFILSRTPFGRYFGLMKPEKLQRLG